MTMSTKERITMQNVPEFEDKFERCCACGKLTNVERNTDISKRKYYIKGAGQLCKNCYFELYSGNDDLIK